MSDVLRVVADPGWRLSAEGVLGTTDPAEVSRRIGEFCRDVLAEDVEAIFFFELSVGAALGVRLRDERRVMVKVYSPERPADFVQAVFRVQEFLSRQGFPCPRPLAAPASFGAGLATAEEFVDDGDQADAHDARIRRTLSNCLAELIRLTEPFRAEIALGRGFSILRHPVWPKPHSPIFDFERTALGAEWIDEFARRAREVLMDDRSPLVVGHSDWSVKHFRFVGNRVRVVYDWDSLMREREAFLVGTAAAHFTSVPPDWRPPEQREAAAFVDEYERARATPFSAAERRAVQAAYVYGTAYTARCQHALDPDERDGGGFREALRAATRPS